MTNVSHSLDQHDVDEALINHTLKGACESIDTAYQVYFDLEKEGSREAMYSIGVMWCKNDDEIPQHFFQAERFLSKAAHHGFSLAAYEFGLLCYNYGLEKTALKYLEQADNQGVLNAALLLGYLYTEGSDVGQDDPEARKYRKNSSQRAILQAEVRDRSQLQGQLKSVGSLKKEHMHLASADLITRNDAIAFQYYKKADEQGIPLAALMLGDMYQKGKGVDQNMTKALEYYKKAESLGIAGASVQIRSLA